MSVLVRLPRELYPARLAGLDAASLTAESARAAAWLAQLAYEDAVPKIRSVAADWNLTLLGTQNDGMSAAARPGGIRWLLLAGYGRRYLVFSGTDPLVLGDWKTDLAARLNDDDIHSGFAEALERAWGRLGQDLERAEGAWVVGHSLGAALAALFAWRASREGHTPSVVYGFGMPRLGGERFADLYEARLGSRTFRFVYGEDVVAGAPPSSLGYRHVGRRLSSDGGGMFDIGGMARIRDDEPLIKLAVGQELLAVVRRLLPRRGRPGRSDWIGTASRLLPAALADHLPDRYWNAFP